MIEVKKYIIDTVEMLEKCKPMWIQLEDGKDMTIYQSFRWNKLLFEEEKSRFLSSIFSSIVFYSVFKDAKIVALLPIIVQKHRNKTKWFGRNKGLYILGHSSYSDYLNIVYNDEANEECIKTLIESIKKDYSGWNFYVTDIREGTKFQKFLEEQGATCFNKDVAVQVEKRKTIEEYEKSLSKHVRQNLRTAKNRMDKTGIEYQLTINGKTEDELLINQLIDIHIGRMIEKNMVDTDILHKMSSIIRIKYRKRRELSNNIVAESMRRMEESCLVIVYLNGDIAGYLYGLKDKSTIRIMQNCVKDEYKFYSPLFRGAYDFILEEYENDLIQTIDFTRGNEQYKYNLGGVEVNLYSYSLNM